MEEKNQHILEAATKTFSRYGIAKTTMSDIAREAGVARQTVYNAFPGKPEVLRACVRMLAARAQQDVLDAWKTTDDLQDCLEVFHRLGPICWFEMVQNAPDSAELFEGMHSAAQQELKQADQKWIEMFADLFAQRGDGLATTGFTPLEFAEFFYTTSANAKHSANDLAHLKRRLEVLRGVALKSLLAV